MEQRAENACGSHGFANGKAVFDYTCDDCMLPPNHIDYDETPEYKRYYANHTDNEEGNKKSEEPSETQPF